jgi:hypothetical protein
MQKAARHSSLSLTNRKGDIPRRVKHLCIQSLLPSFVTGASGQCVCSFDLGCTFSFSQISCERFAGSLLNTTNWIISNCERSFIPGQILILQKYLFNIFLYQIDHESRNDYKNERRNLPFANGLILKRMA